MGLGIDTDNVEMVTTDDGDGIPAQYQEFVEVFSKEKAKTLPPHRPNDHMISLEPDYKLSYGQTYNLPEFESKTHNAYLEINLANGFIQQSSSSAAVPILFATKKHRWLRLCVDYWALKLGTVKNWCPLPLNSELLDRVCEACIFTQLDLWNAYHPMWIEEGDEFKSVFRTRYGQFEFRVMPFRLTNVPATFQAYIDNCLRPYIGDFTVCYLDNILFYSTNEKEHEDHIWNMLQHIQEFVLNCNTEKCQFAVREVGFL